MNVLLGILRLGAVLGVAGPLRVHEYLGPETIMPLASILAAVLGFFLMFWRVIFKFTKKIYRKIRGIPDEAPPDADVIDSVEEEKDI